MRWRCQASHYDFLLQTYETEILKITGLWHAFPQSAADFRPALKSRTVIEQMEHQVQSEGRWMKVMLDIDTGGFKSISAGRSRAWQ